MQNADGSAQGQSATAIGEAKSRTTIPPERIIVLFLCLFAAARIFIFSSAFPFFNNVDEPIHFDLVLRYAHGQVPNKLDVVLPETVPYIAFFNSPAYFATPDQFPGGQFPPPAWTEPPEQKRHDFDLNCARWQSLENYEVSQPPLYYALAGIWWHLGQWCGLHGGRLLYWLHFFNIILATALVWLAYLAARMIFPENTFIRLAAPALLAFLPQTAFYTISNDPLSAVCFGATFICLLKWLRVSKPSALLGTLTGLAFAATYLAKICNIPLLFIAVAVLAFVTIKSIQRWQVPWAALLAFAGCAVPPIIGWMIWCDGHFGDLTGAKLACDHFNITIKPFAEWWHHPIFSPAGIWTYLSGQLSTFWQGELIWHGQPLILSGSAVVYPLLSLLLLIVAFPASLPEFSEATRSQCRALQLSFVCLVAALGFFALTSIAYNFDDCPYPSRQYPYLTSGRLLLGMLIPFLILIAFGLDRLLHRLGNTGKFAALAALAVLLSAMLITEIATDWPVFSDPYNWFHLP